ncbi:MAG: arginine repressor [Acidobacteria bacterium]|nr:arginine repressor [Acidobacteriota bacterium]
MTTSPQRRDEIIRVIRNGVVSSQEELLAKLAKRGIRVAQPTLSRDLRELGVVKTPDGYAIAETLTAALLAPKERREDKLDSTIHGLVLTATLSGTIVVLRTPPAQAQPVARAIDEADLPDVAGTLGGDDTVFVAMTSTSAAHAFERRVRALTSPAPSRRRTRT